MPARVRLCLAHLGEELGKSSPARMAALRTSGIERTAYVALDFVGSHLSSPDAYHVSPLGIVYARPPKRNRLPPKTRTLLA